MTVRSQASNTQKWHRGFFATRLGNPRNPFSVQTFSFLGASATACGVAPRGLSRLMASGWPPEPPAFAMLAAPAVGFSDRLSAAPTISTSSFALSPATAGVLFLRFASSPAELRVGCKCFTCPHLCASTPSCMHDQWLSPSLLGLPDTRSPRTRPRPCSHHYPLRSHCAPLVPCILDSLGACRTFMHDGF